MSACIAFALRLTEWNFWLFHSYDEDIWHIFENILLWIRAWHFCRNNLKIYKQTDRYVCCRGTRLSIYHTTTLACPETEQLMKKFIYIECHQPERKTTVKYRWDAFGQWPCCGCNNRTILTMNSVNCLHDAITKWHYTKTLVKISGFARITEKFWINTHHANYGVCFSMHTDSCDKRRKKKVCWCLARAFITWWVLFVVLNGCGECCTGKTSFRGIALFSTHRKESTYWISNLCDLI